MEGGGGISRKEGKNQKRRNWDWEGKLRKKTTGTKREKSSETRTKNVKTSRKGHYGEMMGKRI